MRERASRQKLEKALRDSRAALPGWVVFAVFGCVLVWGTYRLAHTPLHYEVLFPLFSVPIVHLIKIVYCWWALRRLARARPAE
jgi:hypothetical protein